MKKYFLSLVAIAAMLLATSCQESLVEPQVAGTTTFSIEIPTQMGTKAADETYKLYVEVYSAEGNQWIHRLEDEITSGVPKTFSLSLVANQEYDIIFWAQHKDSGYDVKDLRNVELNQTNHNSESGAAYYAIKNNFKPSENSTASVELRRPFAQLNIGTLLEVDYNNEGNNKMTINSAKITVSDVASEFNRVDVTGEVGVGQKTVQYVGSEKPYLGIDGDLTVSSVDYEYISMDYLPVIDNQALVTVTVELEVTDPFGVQSKITRTINSVPVQMNYRTNIVGDLITSTSNFTVEIVEDWAGADNNILTSNVIQKQIDDAIETAKPGDEVEIKISSDVQISENPLRFGTPTKSGAAASEIKFILDLNGKTINADLVSEGRHLYAIENYADLTIKGPGTINARGNFNYGKLTVGEGVTINAIDGNGGYGVQNLAGSEFVLDGGTIATTLEDDNKVSNGGFDATTLRVEKGAKATIEDGKINNICDFTFAIDNYGTVEVKGGTVTSVHSTVSNYGTLTINGGSFTCNGIEGITAHALVVWDGSQTTINGGVFDGKDNYNGFNVDANKGANVLIKGGEFRKVHSGSLYGEGIITVQGGKFFDEVPANRLAEGYVVIEVNEGEETFYVVDGQKNQ